MDCGLICSHFSKSFLFNSIHFISIAMLRLGVGVGCRRPSGPPAAPRRLYSTQPQKQLQGRTAVVTGSTAGIGLGIARELAKAGANVVINGFGEEKEIQKTLDELRSYNVKAIHHGADMSKPKEVTALIREAEVSFGKVDILVNNAGIQFVAPVHEFPADKWDAIIAINLSSSFHTIKAVIPGMKERKWGE